MVEALVQVGPALILGPPKSGKPRTIAIPAPIAEALGMRLAYPPGPDGLVFTAPDGGPLKHSKFVPRQ